MPIYERTRLLISQSGIDRLAGSNVLIAGLGGVGSFAAEAIARAGVGRITLLDNDNISNSNINRQLLALHSTVGRPKTEVMAERICDINPDVKLNVITKFINPDNAANFVTAESYSFVLDCIDSIACKAALVYASQQEKVPIISALGAGGRIDPSQVKITTLNNTFTCPLARELRRRLRALQGTLKYPVIFSKEEPLKATTHEPVGDPDNPGIPRAVNGTISYLPGIFGLMMAGYVVKNLLGRLAHT
jgi:tRNA A37 threonylcarbamoyladenosine dehydratase